MRVRCAVKFGYKKAPAYAEAGLFGFTGLLLLHHRLPAAIVFVHDRVVLFAREAVLIGVFGVNHHGELCHREVLGLFPAYAEMVAGRHDVVGRAEFCSCLVRFVTLQLTHLRFADDAVHHQVLRDDDHAFRRHAARAPDEATLA